VLFMEKSVYAYTCKELVMYTLMNNKLTAVELRIKVWALALLSSEPLQDLVRAH